MDKAKQTIRNGLLRILFLLLVLSLNWAGFASVGNTLALFFDEEASNANLYQAGILDFYLEEGEEFSPQSITPCISSERTIELKNNGNLFQYSAKADDFSGNLCDSLDLLASLDGTEKYSGLLTGFDMSSFQFEDSESWDFELSLNSRELSLQNKSCEFNFIFKAWQKNVFDDSMGFSDTETVSNKVETGSWLPEVEVLYPDGGEVWYLVPPGLARLGLGMYNIRWDATSPVYENDDLSIDIWFCKDSGANCFHNIVTDTENDGSYIWTIPYQYDFITDEARIKVVAKDPCSFEAEDQSDADFCPPMLSSEDVEKMLLSMQLEEGVLSLEFSTSSEDDIFEIEELALTSGTTVDPIETATQPVDGTISGSQENQSPEDVEFEINVEAPVLGNITDPIEVATPGEDGVEE